MNKIDIQNAPNPYFARENTFSLNTLWDFDLTTASKPNYRRKILVPFAPETEMSGINKTVKPNQTMFYRLVIDEDNEFKNLAAKIYFEAVDQICDVYWNGSFCIHHEGGYWPFSVTVPHLYKGDVIEVVTKDDTSSDVYAKGKQSLKPKNIWYKGTSGIWGNVYVEYLPNGFNFDKVDISASFNQKKVVIDLGHNVYGAKIEITTPTGNVLRGKSDDYGEAIFNLEGNFHPWSPENPNLYRVVVSKDDDVVNSLFAVRKIEKITKRGKDLIALNGKPVFLSALLDQGYYSPETGMTVKSQSDIKAELERIKTYGFNALRKHIKIESPRWYYECDRLGILVIQDMVNGGGKIPFIRLLLAPFIKLKVDDTNYESVGRAKKQSRDQFEIDLLRTVRLLSKHPSIIVWTLFNEGWGQFDSVRLTKSLRMMDDSRLIDSTSGWFDTKAGDFNSRHIYFRKPKLKNKKGRILSLSEYGGFAYAIPRHSQKIKRFGYAKYRNADKLLEAYRKCFLNTLSKNILNEALSVAVLTQWSDVEGEINGLVTYDRKVSKLDPKEMSNLNKALYDEFDKTWG